MACTAASTTGKYSGRHPAITALAATFSTVATPPSGSISPSEAWRSTGLCPSISSMRPSVGGTMGSPSVQPRSRYSRFTSSVGSAPRIISTRWRGNSPASGVRASSPFSSARARSVSSIHSPEARWPAGSSTQSASTRTIPRGPA